MKMTNRGISLLLCFVMVFGLLPMQTMAAETVASGTSGSASWMLEDGVFTISGGEMENYGSAAERPWHAYAAQIQKVVIGSGVVRVGDYAFANCTNLTEVEIGSSVHTIGAYAFENTTSLTEAKMPKNVKVFCDGMFHNSGLKKLYVYSRYTEFEGFYSVGYDEDTVLPLDTVIYCYDCSHAYFYFNRETVILTDDLVMDVDNGDGNIELNVEHPDYVRDLWSAANSQDALVLDSSIYINTDDAMRIHNELVAEGKKIGPDYNNNGKLEVEVRIELRDQNQNGITTIWGSAHYSFHEYSLEYEYNKDYLQWDCWSGAEDVFSVTPSDGGVTVDFHTNMQELGSYAGEPVSWVFVYVAVKGISHKYNYSYRYEYVDKTTTFESCGASLYDAHLRESEIAWGEDRVGVLTLDYEFVVDDWAPYYDDDMSEEYANYYEPVSRHYQWYYRISREGYFYDEETDTYIYPGQDFWELTEGMFTETYNGVLYGGVAGVYDAGSDPSVSLREMLPAEQLAFVETLKGVEASGMGGEARIELGYILTLTYADGSVVVLENGSAGDETTSIAGVCLHTCAVCGLCTSEELLECNSRYGWRVNECTCENPSPAIESSSVEDAQVVDSNAWCGDVTARVETFDVEMAVTTDYFKAIINSVGSSNVAAVFDITIYNEWGEAYTLNEWGGTEEYVTLSIPVSAEIAQAAAGGELVLYHVDENGKAETVSFTVDTVNNTLTFTGTSFSPYVLLEVVPYYGRSQLATMPNSAALLYAYDQIAAGVEISAESIEVYNGVDALSKDELRMVMDAYRRDYAHHFWLGNGYSYSSAATTVFSVIPQYIMSGEELENARTAFDRKVQEILSGLTAEMTEFEKELYLHDTLAGMITYEFTDNCYNAYGAIIEGKAVCEGYAEALQYLLQRAGIQSFIATGSSINPGTGSSENHAWNYVRIDGEYYHVDLTWNDQDTYLFHAYFNQTDAVIQEDHAIGETVYALPVCDAVDAMYFTGKDTYLDSYTAASVGQLLKSNAMRVQVYIPGSVDAFISWYSSNVLSIAMNAGVSGSISYGYVSLGREVIVYLNGSCSHRSMTYHPGVDATCTEEGYAGYYECECGKYFANANATVEITDPAAWQAGDGKIAALGHEMGEWYAVDEATCTEDGLERRDCSRCDHYETRVIEAGGHNYVPLITEPTCTEAGYITHVCGNCGDSYVDSYMEPTGHSYGEWYIVTAPTCTEEGEKRHDCVNCDHYETAPVDATGHNYTADVTKPTCTEQGYTTHTCTKCGHSYVDSYVDAAGHHYGAWYMVSEATCTEDGENRRDCLACGHCEVEIIAATGHDYHSVVTEPTCTEAGYTTHTCMVCGYTCTDSYVDATGHSYVDGKCQHCGEEDPNGARVGDVNGDGVVNYLDAMMIAQYYVGDIGEEDMNLTAADVNGDGVVNYLDAMMVAQYYVGDIDSFPAED